MRPIREAPLPAALLLVGFAFFAGGADSDGALPWLGTGALAAAVLCLAVRGRPGGLRALVPLAALAAWCGITIAWSSLPDRSWDYANRALVYGLFALVGLWLVDRRRELALGLAALLGAVAVWSLAGLVFPGLNGDTFRSARLSAPVGLWNQLALLGDFALPLALWLAGRRRASGTLLAYAWIVVVALTLSRGGIAVAAIVTLVWLALSRAAVDGVVTLLAGGVPAGAVVAAAFALPGVTSAGQPHATRWHDGLIFGAALVGGAVAAMLLARVPRPEVTPRLRRGVLAVCAAVVVAGAVAAGLKAGSAWHQFTNETPVANSSNRLGSSSSNFRWVWWQQAWHGFQVHPGGGTGAGTFKLTNLLYRQSSLDTATEPHQVPLQFLSETGIPGLLLFLAVVAVFVAASVPVLRRRRGHELALALVLPAWFLHGLVDIDWDFVAVSGPAFLVAGSLAARPARRVSPFAVLAAAGASLAVVVCLLLPWLGRHWDGDAQAALASSPSHALALARKARSADPLLVDAVTTEAEAQYALDNAPQAYLLYAHAASMQPDNPYVWRSLGEFLMGYGCLRLAYPALQRYTDLNDHALASQGATEKDVALAYVNSGRADPRYCGG